MNRAQKAEFIEGIRDAFDAASLLILTEFKGSTVAEMNQLRRACEEAGANFRVVKNTLTKRAIADSEREPLTEFFVGNVGVVIAGEDPVAAAKAFKKEAKENEKLVVKAGFFEGTVVDSKEVVAVADLPSREELLAKLLATMQEGPRQVLGVIQGPARDLLYLLNNYAAKLDE